MPVGWWNFDNSSNITAAVPGYGTDLVLTGTQEAVAGPSGGNGATRIGVGSYFTATHGIAPNGGGAKVNQYSLMFDFRVDQALGMWHNFFQTDPTVAANDGEYFIRSTTGALGTLDLAYTTPFVVANNTWYRLILTVENGTFFKAYVDGQFQFDHNIRPIDDVRYSLASVLHVFGDDDGDDGLIDCAEFAIWDYALSAAEVAALGTVGTIVYADIEDVEVVASDYKLYNNYPNPFNPSTIVAYNLPAEGLVSLKVYNAIGEMVTELINENQTAGYHQISFNANNLPSGIYFAELKANDYVHRIKMMLVK
jgi:hypothetical protein